MSPTLSSPDTRQYIRNLALKLQGVPYIYGGEHPWIGLDCSGFVIWILQVFNVLPSGDWNADTLFDMFGSTDDPKPGDLCFYGKHFPGDNEYRVSHVMIYIGHLDGFPYCIGASGGDSEVTTAAIAKERNELNIPYPN